MLLEPEDKNNYKEMIDQIKVGMGEDFHPLAFEYITKKNMILNMSKEQLQWYACHITALFFNSKIVTNRVLKNG